MLIYLFRPMLTLVFGPIQGSAPGVHSEDSYPEVIL